MPGVGALSLPDVPHSTRLYGTELSNPNYTDFWAWNAVQ